MGRWVQSARRVASAPFRLAWRVLRFVAPLAPEPALHRLIWAGGGLFLTMAIGVVGYRAIDGFSLFDALYQTVLTLTTVGFQEVHLLSDAARAFTIFLMLFGVGIALYLLAAIATLILEGDLYRDVDGRRKQHMIDKLIDHTVFVGAGRMGLLVAEALAASGRSLVVIEPNEQAASEVRERNWMVLAESAEREAVLRAAGVERAERLYVMTGSDAVNMVVTIRASKLSPELNITTRVNDPNNKELLLEVGASDVLSPGELLAREVMSAMTNQRHSQPT